MKTHEKLEREFFQPLKVGIELGILMTRLGIEVWRGDVRRVLFRLELGHSKHLLGSWTSLVLLQNGNLCIEQFIYIILVCF